jgi:hypothetical protein
MTSFTKVIAILAIVLVSACLTCQSLTQAQQAPVNPQPSTPSGLPAYDKTIVAYVNGQSITRQELAEDLVARKGRQHLQLMINRRIIEQAAKNAGITVTEAEVDAELHQLVKFAQLPSLKEFEDKILKSPKYKTTLLEYREDVIKEGLYMRKLAGQRLDITEAELHQAYDARFGEKVKCRMIVAPDQKTAFELHTKIRHESQDSKETDPKQALYQVFLHYARQQADAQLAAVAGDIQPIGRFALSNNVEKTAFNLRDGEMSEVVELPEGASKAYVILLRERTVPPDTSRSFDEVRTELRQNLLEQKMRVAVPELFRQLRNNAAVHDYLNNEMDIKDVLQLLPTQTAATPRN